MFTIHTLRLLFCIWPVYIINIHIWQAHFLVFSEHLSSTFCCYHCCCLLWKWARAFPRIFCTVTLTKITSDITQASGWARLLVSTFFFPPLIYFLSVPLISVNSDGKEKRHISVSFYDWPVLQGKGTQRPPDLGTPRFRASRSPWEPLTLPNAGLPPRRSGQCWRARKSPAGERLWWRSEGRPPGRPGNPEASLRRVSGPRCDHTAAEKDHEDFSEITLFHLTSTTRAVAPESAALLPNSVD